MRGFVGTGNNQSSTDAAQVATILFDSVPRDGHSDDNKPSEEA
jgi:hypothetical protein